MNPKDFIIRNQGKRLHTNGLDLLKAVPAEFASAVFFDPQYREIMEYMNFGNEGSRQMGRAAMPQMDAGTIIQFLIGIERALKPGGYLFFWMDKFMLVEGVYKEYLHFANDPHPTLHKVDLITWDKCRMGMGKRSRRQAEYLLVLQKSPKGIASWTNKGIPDVWSEKIEKPRSKHAHTKPVGLLTALISSVVKRGDYVLDPCAGSFTTLTAATRAGCRFIGCDLSPKYGTEEPVW